MPLISPIVEAGAWSDVAVQGDEVVKTLRIPFETETAARQEAEDLVEYVGLFDSEPLRAATLSDVSVIGNGDEGYLLRHTYKRIAGLSMARLEGDEKQAAVRTTLSQVVLMHTVGDDNTLAAPFDGRDENLNVDADGPALTDLYPILTRLPDGSFPAHRMGPPRHRNICPETMGTKSGVMVKLLSSAVLRGETTAEKVRHMLLKADDWCYDALPADLPVYLKRPVEWQIRSHFMPYIAAMAQHRVCRKLGW